MYYLIIDTCVWIDLCKKFPEVLEKIKALIISKKTSLIVPNIVVDEWNRNKPKILEGKEQSFRELIKSAKKLSAHVSQEDIEKYEEILGNLEKVDAKAISNESIGIVEYLFNHPTTIKMEVTDSAKIQAANTALDKKAPFGNKNSMGDALIVFPLLNI